MKTNKLIVLLLVLSICGCSKEKEPEISWEPCESELIISPPSAGACFPEVCDKYVYPIVPGMKEWINLDPSEDPAKKFCQLPDKVLQSISTPGLIDALIYAPMFGAMYHLYNIKSTYARWHAEYNQFNSGRELFQRKDAAVALIEYHKLLCYDCFDSLIGKEPSISNDLYKYRVLMRIMGFEYLFTKQEILDKMDHAQKKETVATILTNREQRSADGLTDFELSSNGLYYITIITHIMYADEYGPIVEYARDNDEIFQSLLQGDVYSDQEDTIISFAKNFITK